MDDNRSVPKSFNENYFSLQIPGPLDLTTRNLSEVQFSVQYHSGEIIWHVATGKGKLDGLQEKWELHKIKHLFISRSYNAENQKPNLRYQGILKSRVNSTGIG